MALCTVAQVLQHLGMSDVASSAPAIIIEANTPSGSSTVSQITLGLASNILTITPTVTAGPAIAAATFTLTAAAYDTMGELATAINALPYCKATLAAEDSSTPSTLLSVDATPIAVDVPTSLTYTNDVGDGSVAFITAKILEVQALAENYCCRAFDTASFDERLDGNGSETITLRNAPVTAVSAITIINPDGTVAQTMATTDYYLDGTNGILFARSSGGTSWTDSFFDTGLGDGPATRRAPLYRWPYGSRNVRVQYTGGYSTIPYDLRLAAIQCVCDLFYDRANNRLVTTDSNQGRMVVRNPGAMNQMIQTYFGPWRRGF